MTTNTEEQLREALERVRGSLEFGSITGWKPEQAKGGEAVSGELDPLRAYEFGQLITRYSESFNGQNWDSVCDSVDRKNLAVALDHLTEAGAMLMNISERLLRTNHAPAASVSDEREAFEAWYFENVNRAELPDYLPTLETYSSATVANLFCAWKARAALRPAQPAASVSDEQIAACVKRASTYGLPFVGLLNPGGTPSDFSKRFTAEILALRPAQAGGTMTDAWADGVQAAADLLKRMANEMAMERGETDPATGAIQFKSAATREWHASLGELAEEIERLKPANDKENAA